MTQTVLILDDHALCRESIAASLRGGAGYRVLCADRARRALAIMEDHSPDLLLTALPDMSGIEFLKIVRESPAWRHIPAILFTGSGDVTHLLGGLGVRCCLTKSIASVAHIRAAILDALGGPTAGRKSA